MNSLTFGTLFSGVEGAGLGLTRAGYKPVYAVEWNLGAIGILKANHDTPIVIHDNVCNVDYSTLPPVDLLWASPVCCSYSLANHNRGETQEDFFSAEAIASAARFANTVVIENVPAYYNGEAFKLLSKQLTALVFDNYLNLRLNAARFGNPSSRDRSYGIFSKKHIKPVLPEELRSNWFDELLKHYLYWEPSKLTDNQSKAIQASGIDLVVDAHSPFAIERCGYYGTPKIISSMDTFPCLKSHSGHDGKNPKPGYGKIGKYRRQYDFVSHGQSYALTPQLMGVLMGFPINYDWGSDKGQAVAGIGNSVCPSMSEIIARLIIGEKS
jgi:site-specific DNA-cytosine methylase